MSDPDPYFFEVRILYTLYIHKYIYVCTFSFFLSLSSKLTKLWREIEFRMNYPTDLFSNIILRAVKLNDGNVKIRYSCVVNAYTTTKGAKYKSKIGKISGRGGGGRGGDIGGVT